VQQVPVDQPCVALDMVAAITQSPAAWTCRNVLFYYLLLLFLMLMYLCYLV